MSRNPGTYLDQLYCYAIKIYCRDTGTTQEEIAQRLGLHRVRLSQILNHYCAVGVPVVREVEQMAQSLLLQTDGLMDKARAEVEKEKKRPVDPNKLIARIQALPDSRKLEILQEIAPLL